MLAYVPEYTRYIPFVAKMTLNGKRNLRGKRCLATKED